MPTGSTARRAGTRPSPAQARALLAERLRERLAEIGRVALTRLYGVSDAPERPDPDYVEGLKSATAAALEYLLAGVERGESESLYPPPAVLVQARLAARNRVALDIVMRRCFAGHALFNDFLIGEVERLDSAEPDLLKRLLRDQAALFERMFAAVGEEYTREAASRPAAAERRRARLVERLLAGEPLDTTELGYEMDAHHLAVLAKGPGALKCVRELARTLDRRLLVVPRHEDLLWVWLGGGTPLDPNEILCRASTFRPTEVRLALGEPGEGAEGWRFSHRQAVAALPIALRGEAPVVRYADVALLTAVLKDELLVTSLRKMYLEPLETERDGGRAARDTLQAYFAADRNAASTAATLGVSRQAVKGRLHTIEGWLGRSLTVCAAELEILLLMDALN